MEHERHFTVEEANAELDLIRDRLVRLRAAREGLTDEEARAELAEATPSNGGGRAGKVVSDGFLALRSILAELQGMGVIVRDLDRGLVDFPSLRDGREVYLCWVEGEDEIEYWHDIDSGFSGREPL
ncbi:MAG: hypothetical protein QOG62_1274 [Thermoleophilaceae bacterium]|nr:hypothetical protein [Thermoleophilaceae bacterium]